MSKRFYERVQFYTRFYAISYTYTYRTQLNQLNFNFPIFPRDWLFTHQKMWMIVLCVFISRIIADWNIHAYLTIFVIQILYDFLMLSLRKSEKLYSYQREKLGNSNVNEVTTFSLLWRLSCRSSIKFVTISTVAINWRSVCENQKKFYFNCQCENLNVKGI